MSAFGQAASFAVALYRQRAAIAYAGYVKREPIALLQLRPGRDDPYPLYDRIRQAGPLSPGLRADWTSATYRAQWRALCDDPDGLAPRAVEETLRFDPPVQLTSRFALQPVELEGRALARGHVVTVLIGGANRDPAVYDQPDTFDINRDSEVGSLAFSSGIHYCVGQPLARLEATIALRMLAERMPGLSRGGPVRRRGGFVIRGPLSLPVTTGARRAAAAPQPAVSQD